MNTALLFDFTVNKETCTVKVTREFKASQNLVWQTWTDPELLDQWWAPVPYKSITKKMDFNSGGRRLYKMVGPEGDEHWCFADYTSIHPKENFSYTDGFCDSEGNKTNFIAGADWTVNFSESDGITTVLVQIKHKSLEDLEKIIEMGFKEGFIICIEQLDQLLKQSVQND
tara:strand:+ start:62345 stop:62854 length:510 start_codon:yes stop_codon:yes gene_type:complete